MSPSDVAIVVPVGGAAPAWARAAASLARLDPPPGALIVVIDGPDTQGHGACAAVAGGTVVALESRGGPARARNLGARAATCDVLLFLDSDVEVPHDLVARVVSELADPQVTAIFGSYDDAPADPRWVSQYRNLLHHAVHQRAAERASTFWAGCGAVRRHGFLEAGGFDERYTDPSIEDIELGTRLVASGHAIRLVKHLEVKHLKRWTLGQVLWTDLFARAVPWTELMLGHGRLVNDLNVTVKDRVSVTLAMVPLAAVPLAFWAPVLLVVAAACMAAVLAMNAPLFRFFHERRGLAFAAATVPLYWLYLVTCGIGFALGVARHLVGRRGTITARAAPR